MPESSGNSDLDTSGDEKMRNPQLLWHGPWGGVSGVSQGVGGGGVKGRGPQRLGGDLWFYSGSGGGGGHGAKGQCKALDVLALVCGHTMGTRGLSLCTSRCTGKPPRPFGRGGGGCFSPAQGL